LGTVYCFRKTIEIVDVKRKQPKIYQLKMRLKHIRPPIWRRVQVCSNTPLLELHAILQAAMGWTDSHLHQFVVGDTYYGQPEIDEFGDPNLKDERKARLDQLLSNSRRRIIYEYDFGDGWEHEILLEKVLEPVSRVKYPRCIGGARACPPEDCGGTGGYIDFLAAISDPEHEEHEEYLEWIGGSFDPEEFDPADFEDTLQMMLEFSED
jgi:hypothetical protein